MSLPQDNITAECSVCHTITVDWRNFEGTTFCHECFSDVVNGATNYETTC